RQPYIIFFFASRRRNTRSKRDWSSDVCAPDLPSCAAVGRAGEDDRGSALPTAAQLGEAFGDPVLGDGVDGRGRFDEDEDLGVGEIGGAACREEAEGSEDVRRTHEKRST